MGEVYRSRFWQQSELRNGHLHPLRRTRSRSRPLRTQNAQKKELLADDGHPCFVITVAVFDTKPYDREALQQAAANRGIEWHFLEFRLTLDTAYAAKNARAVCVFVNDQLDRPCLEVLARQGIELVVLRCSGFNNVDIDSARELKLTVTRVPVYSPHAVAEHAVALLLTL